MEANTITGMYRHGFRHFSLHRTFFVALTSLCSHCLCNPNPCAYSPLFLPFTVLTLSLAFFGLPHVISTSRRPFHALVVAFYPFPSDVLAYLFTSVSLSTLVARSRTSTLPTYVYNTPCSTVTDALFFSSSDARQTSQRPLTFNLHS